jgi:peptidoglycan/LPS O-acetylase OafA/YrhL
MHRGGGDEAAATPRAKEETRRFAYIDALRGLAALAVCGVHFYADPSYHQTLQRLFPRWLGYSIATGSVGVQVFFVLSGFVIAHSIRGSRVTARFLGNFALRRSLRLDPPYWTAIFVVLALNAIGRRVLHDTGFPQPSVGEVVLNMFYLPRAAGYDHFIVTVAWTLAIEIQFYLVLVSVVGLAQRVGRGRVLGYPTAGYALFFTALAAAGLACNYGLLHLSYNIFLVPWMLFFLGVLAWWSLERSVWRGWFWVYATLTALAYFHEGDVRNLLGVATATSIYVGGMLKKLYGWLNVAPLQFLGRISYSLYLGHAMVGQKTIKLGHRFLGDSPVAAVGLFLGAFVVSICFASLMYRWVERPSVRLAKRIKLKPRGEGETRSATSLEGAAF